MEELANSLSHDELLNVTQSSLAAIFKSDPLLSDIPPDVILEEIVSQIAVERGQSITIYVAREDEPKLRVIIPQRITVRGLKKAIARHFQIHQQRVGDDVKISWKYIWKTYNLCYDSTILDNDAAMIGDYNVKNRVTLTFKKKRKNDKYRT